MDQSTGIKWKTATGMDDISPDSDMDGRVNNTNRSGTLSDFPAFELCENLTRHGYTDWYLPARGELQVLYTNKDAIGGLLTSSAYWSSTESNTTNAWHLRSSGSIILTHKTPNIGVRCIRRN